jgi:hypothetical protein
MADETAAAARVAADEEGKEGSAHFLQQNLTVKLVSECRSRVFDHVTSRNIKLACTWRQRLLLRTFAIDAANTCGMTCD